MSGADLPEAAERRLAARSWSSSLSVADFAALLHLGMRPVGLVQGFCVMGWSRQGLGIGIGGSWAGGSVVQTYPCPHGYGAHDINENPTGYTVEVDRLERAWAEGYAAARRRMLEEAAEAGADGVVAVVDTSRPLLGEGVREFHLLGTAVVLDEDASGGAGGAGGGGVAAAVAARGGAGAVPWSTFLAGAKLVKLFEAGMAPVSVVAGFCELVVQPGCVTELQERGAWDPWRRVDPAGEVVQMSDAATEVRRRVREQVRRDLGDGTLHGADLQVTEGHRTLSATLRGTRVRQVHDVEPLPAPVPTVHLR